MAFAGKPRYPRKGLAHSPCTNVTRLVYFERFDYIRDAIARENGIKRMLRAQKIALIESMNPQWQDLSEK